MYDDWIAKNLKKQQKQNVEEGIFGIFKLSVSDSFLDWNDRSSCDLQKAFIKHYVNLGFGWRKIFKIQLSKFFVKWRLTKALINQSKRWTKWRNRNYVYLDSWELKPNRLEGLSSWTKICIHFPQNERSHGGGHWFGG